LTPRKKKILILSSVLLGIALLATPVVLSLHAWAEFLTPVTDPNQYQSILKSYSDRFSKTPADLNVLAYFPDSIPAEASQVRFYRGTPPGDMSLELHCVLPAAEVAALEARVFPLAMVEEGQDDVPRIFPTVPGHPTLTQEFTLYLLGVGHGNKNDEEESHWTYEYGVAIDRQTNEVIYWLNGHAS